VIQENILIKETLKHLQEAHNKQDEELQKAKHEKSKLEKLFETRHEKSVFASFHDSAGNTG